MPVSRRQAQARRIRSVIGNLERAMNSIELLVIASSVTLHPLQRDIIELAETVKSAISIAEKVESKMLS
ncbi:MAG: hypothetical protein H5U03_00140 [Clostridia bacterium]|nr:hypothetical protein [Clostridia bacterium]